MLRNIIIVLSAFSMIAASAEAKSHLKKSETIGDFEIIADGPNDFNAEDDGPSSTRTYYDFDGKLVSEKIKKSNTPVPGVTAQCADGKWSFSASHNNVCRHNGGVAHWFK